MIGRISATRRRMLRATVTHLRMATPPRHYPHPPIGMPLSVSRCRSIPLHFYRYLYDRVGRDWHWTAALTLSDKQLEERLESPRTDINVLYLDACPAGFFELRLLNEQDCRLVHFGLMRHAIGRGISRWFLGEAIRTAWKHEPEVVSVETCTLDHPAALPLYQKMGFSPVWQKDEYVTEISPEVRTAVILRD
ncbi:GNAT family N-acetyltransferase [Chelativorans sp. Marseille-P2723]|uniref:GNAT family N-acetyltransferase n=1 Tax=Chelativorans sp. Marseille-P2723 TaxID=2709133 RepID=UPI00156FCB87|nr:GNAT family N-acetyltransferase [Chelativorans sp. Marseille-P2723]